MITDLTAASLEECLLDFQERFNTNARVRKLIQGWNRSIFIDPTDSGVPYTMRVEGLQLTSVRPGTDRVAREGDEYLVHLQAEEEILKEIFTGGYNPATALIDGALAVFSNERDKVKLEAIAMVIWGL